MLQLPLSLPLVHSGNAGYPDFTNPEMRAWWASMFAYDQYEVRISTIGIPHPIIWHVVQVSLVHCPSPYSGLVSVNEYSL